MTTVTLHRLLAAAAIGIAYHWTTVLVWGVLGVSNPINEVLLDVFVRGERHPMTYRAFISLHDVVVNLLMALPFAAIFRYVPTLRNWTYVALAAATAVIAGYASMNWESLPLLVSSWFFWLGLAMVALSLPVTFASLNRIRSGSSPRSVVQDAA